MAIPGLNLSKFKKIKDDKKTAHLQDDKGHVIMLAKSALSALQRKAIERLPLAETQDESDVTMAEGGEVNNTLSPENALNQVKGDEGISGGTVYSGSDDERFLYGDYCFDIDKAREMSQKQPNGEVPVSKLWIDKIKLDKQSAMESTSTNPVFIAQVHTPNGLKPLLIDGNHRMYKAIQEHKKSLPAYIFTPEQTTELFTSKPKDVVHPAKEESKEKDNGTQYFAKGGHVKKMAEGGSPGPAVELGTGKRIAPDPDAGSHEGVISEWLGLGKAKGGAIHSYECENCGFKKMAEGGKAEQPDQSDAQPDQTPAAPISPGPVTINLNTSGQPQVPQPPSTLQQTPDASQLNIPKQPAPAKYDTSGTMLGAAQNVPIAQQNLLGASNTQQAIDTEAGKQAAYREAGYIKARQEVAQQDQDNIEEAKRHTDEYRDYINAHPIEAQRYINNMPGGQRITTALGLFLGGLNGGNNNPAMNYLDKQIAMDIDAQKSNTEQQKNLFGAYMHLYDNQKVASELTKASILDILGHQANLTTARLATPQANNNNNILQAKLQQEKADALIKAGGIIGLTKGSVSAPAGTTVKQPGNASVAIPPGMPNMQAAQQAAQVSQQAAQATKDRVEKEKDLRPGSEPPEIEPFKPIEVNWNKEKQKEFLGSQGVPGTVNAGEVGAITEAANLATATNRAIKEIDKQFASMWKNGADADIITKVLNNQHILGVKLPDLAKLSPTQRAYATAASTVKKQLGNALKGGISQETLDLIEDQLPHKGDTPEQYREKLQNVRNVLLNQSGLQILKKHNLATNLPE